MDSIDKGLILFAVIFNIIALPFFGVGFLIGRNTGPSKAKVMRDTAWSVAQINFADGQATRDLIRTEFTKLEALWLVDDGEVQIMQEPVVSEQIVQQV